MDELLEALKRVNPNIDYAGQTGLYTNKIIDSILENYNNCHKHHNNQYQFHYS